VQIGHAINEKMLTDFVLEASRQRLFHAITDCGAGGLSSAVGEMGATLGADVDLDRVPLKYEGLSATEVWISEAQERMVLAVGPADWPAIARIAADEGVEATAIGSFTGTGRIVLKWQGRTAGDLDCHFLHEGRPKQRLTSRHRGPAAVPVTWHGAGSLGECLVRMLALPDVASKEWIIRQYDHEVQGCSVIKPLLGPGEGPADGTVIRGVLGRNRGIVLGVGLRHRLGWLDPYQMAAGAIVEAITNAVAAGADPDRIALLDNFCWGDTRREESLGTLVEACRACHDMAIAFSAPFVSGKDSLNNCFTFTDTTGSVREISIPPTLLATALGQVEDVRATCTPDLKALGNRLAVVGVTRAEVAGTQLALAGRVSGGAVPTVDAAACLAVCRGIAAALRAGLVQACHDVSDGGLLTAVAEMAIGGATGAAVVLADVPCDEVGAGPDLAVAFGETPGRFVCEVRPADAEAFAQQMAGVAWGWIGEVMGEPAIAIRATDGAVERIPVERLARSWRGEAN
jgi:phosphoribosylformylglycinamidine synthase